MLDHGAEVQVTCLAGCIGGSCSRGDTTVIVSAKHYLKELDVQSGPCGDMMRRRG